MTSDSSCRLCDSADLEPLVDFGHQPVAHRLLKDPRQKTETFPLALHLCRTCGLVQVINPIDPEFLYKSYNFNFSSWKAEPHLSAEIDLIYSDGIPSSACEIGANDGRFLNLLVENGLERCVGVEPNPVSGGRARDSGIPIYEAFLNEALAETIIAEHGTFDLVVFRQVLEHVHDPRAFLNAVDRLLSPGGRIFVDVPDFGPSQDLGDCTTLWEEHVSYFTDKTLRRLMEGAGFAPIDTAWYDFSGGCLAVRAERKDSAIEPFGIDPDELAAADGYANQLEEYKERMHTTLTAYRSGGWRVAIYGAGVRAVAACNFLGLGSLIDVAIDDQAERHGLFIPGCNIPIKGPDQLSDGKTICLLAVNNENEKNVSRHFRPNHPDVRVISVCGPADIWKGLAALEKPT